jgi:hypothetical protein
MQLEHAKATFAGAWILTMSLVGLSVGISDVSGWTLLAGAALLPSIVMLRAWQAPAQTFSEAIREARR